MTVDLVAIRARHYDEFEAAAKEMWESAQRYAEAGKDAKAKESIWLIEAITKAAAYVRNADDVTLLRLYKADVMTIIFATAYGVEAAAGSCRDVRPEWWARALLDAPGKVSVR